MYLMYTIKLVGRKELNMIYEITLKIKADDIKELEDILDKYDIGYEINELSESEVI